MDSFGPSIPDDLGPISLEMFTACRPMEIFLRSKVLPEQCSLSSLDDNHDAINVPVPCTKGPPQRFFNFPVGSL